MGSRFQPAQPEAQLIFVLLLAACFAAPAAEVDWITQAGGSYVRDDQGRVTEVDLASAWIKDDDLARLAELPQLERIDLSYTWISDVGLEHLQRLESVRSLSLFYCDYITDTAIIYLKGWQHLEDLNLEGTDVTSRVFEHLGAITSLRSLRVGMSRVEDEGFENLAPLISLERLAFGGAKMSGRALSLLPLLPALRHLEIGGLQRTDSGLWGVELNDFNLSNLAVLTTLESLDLSDSKVTDSGLEKLAPLTGLKELNLNGTAITAAGLSSLKALPELRTLRLWRCDKIDEQVLAALTELKQLELVDLAETAISEAAVVKLRAANKDLDVHWAARSKDIERAANIVP